MMLRKRSRNENALLRPPYRNKVVFLNIFSHERFDGERERGSSVGPVRRPLSTGKRSLNFALIAVGSLVGEDK